MENLADNKVEEVVEGVEKCVVEETKDVILEEKKEDTKNKEEKPEEMNENKEDKKEEVKEDKKEEVKEDKKEEVKEDKKEEKTEVKKEEKKEDTSKKENFLKQFKKGSGFVKFTASQFMDAWTHYDTDNNGYIEEEELDGFLREFVLSSCKSGSTPSAALSQSAMEDFKQLFMEAYDENKDGKIEISELADILPTDENFLLLFRLNNPLNSSVEFMKIWLKFDTERKGYIATSELGPFLKHILESQNVSVTPSQLEEYTATIVKLFDSNQDGKLQLEEMSRLMPVKDNVLSKPSLKGSSFTSRDIDRLFSVYDQNKNGSIEDDELTGFLKDLMNLSNKNTTLEEIMGLKDALMQTCDTDGDGSISRSELKFFLASPIVEQALGVSYRGDSEDDV